MRAPEAASLLSFGLGLIPLHYPQLVASAYPGFVVWHMGYSGSGPLNAATDSSVYNVTLDMGKVPVSETMFA